MKRYLLYLLVSLCGITSSFAQSLWPAVKKEMHPWTRWWWMGSAVDDSNLDRLLVQYHEAGFGGMEITPIYGATGYEKRYIDFLSPKWMERLSFTVRKAGSLGMGVDMNTGTGWPFGGPQVSREHAAARLVMRQYLLSPGDTLADGMLRSPDRGVGAGGAGVADGRRDGGIDPLQALTAYGDKGEVMPLLDRVDEQGKLRWSPVSGKWVVMAAWSGKTGQRVKRAAPGGEGYVLDHFDAAGVDGYLQRFTDAFGGKDPGVRAFFNDSYEVYGADWTPGLFDLFRQRKGYDLRLHLRELADSGEADGVSRIKSDYREVYGEMLLHNFTGRWNDWAHRNGAISKNQAHGSPSNILDLYGGVDIPECEGFFGVSEFAIPGLRQDPADIRSRTEHNPLMFQFASSAAHFYGKPLTSSETFVWLTEHFRTTLARCKPEVEQLFLAGVNHVFFHGSTYSPQDVGFPGWTFYASAEFNPANSLWSHLSAMNEYITRCQSVLQAGRADNQLMVYWPVYDLWNDPKGMEKRFAMNNVEEWLYPSAFNKAASRLRAAGYSMDFVSDKMIGVAMHSAAEGNKRIILVVPACRLMPAETLKNIIGLARNGALVIFEALPDDAPGWSELDRNRKEFRDLLAGLSFAPVGDSVQEARVGSGRVVVAANLPKALASNHIPREELVDIGLQYIRRDAGDGKYYYIVNHTANVIDRFIPLAVAPGEAVLLDPQSGDYGMAETSSAAASTSGTHAACMKVHVQLQPGEAMIVRTYRPGRHAPTAGTWRYLGKAGPSRSIGGPWSLQFLTGGPVLPAARKLDTLSYWNTLADTATVAFSGTGVYTTSFNYPDGAALVNYPGRSVSSNSPDHSASVNSADRSAGEYLLELKGVKESAHIWINEKDAGILWAFPFRMRIKKYLKPGLNTIRIEVANLMANRIRDMDQKKVPWRNYHEINFVNIQYQPFDASGWKSLESGLAGPVTITPVK